MLKRIKVQRVGLAGISLAVGVGVLVSPAFTLGTLVRTWTSAAIAGAAALAWGMFRWHAGTWELYTQPPSTAFGAMNARIEDVVSAAAATDAVLLTASCFIAGAVCRIAYDRAGERRTPLAMGAAAAVLVLIAQAGLMNTSLAQANARGMESGRIRAVAEARATTRAVVSEVGADDREKLLLGYAERLASLHNLGMPGVQFDFEQYVRDMSEGCLGAETEIAICDNAILAEVRKTGEIPEYATSRSVR